MSVINVALPLESAVILPSENTVDPGILHVPILIFAESILFGSNPVTFILTLRSTGFGMFKIAFPFTEESICSIFTFTISGNGISINIFHKVVLPGPGDDVTICFTLFARSLPTSMSFCRSILP